MAFTHAEPLALAGFLAGYCGPTREAHALSSRHLGQDKKCVRCAAATATASSLPASTSRSAANPMAGAGQVRGA